MKKSFLKKISFCLVFALIFASFCAVTSFADDYGDISYKLNEPENDETFVPYIEIQHYSRDSSSSETVVNIPAEIDDNKVTEIDSDAFKACDTVEDVIIPEGVETIGNSAFKNCVNLKFVIIPSTVKTLGYSAFEGCSSLEYVVFKGETEIGDLAFRGDNNIKYLDLGSVKVVGDGAFYGCENLKTVYIPTSVTEIGKYAFGYTEAGDLPMIINGFSFKSYGENAALDKYVSEKTAVILSEDESGKEPETGVADFGAVGMVSECDDGGHNVDFTQVRKATDTYTGLDLGVCSECGRIITKDDAKTAPQSDEKNNGGLIFIILAIVVCIVAWIIYVKISKKRRAKAIEEYDKAHPDDHPARLTKEQRKEKKAKDKAAEKKRAEEEKIRMEEHDRKIREEIKKEREEKKNKK